MSIRVTAILNLKGGVAKTTTAVNMAAILAKYHNKRVLLIDADPQCNTTEFMGVTKKYQFTLAAMLRGSIAELSHREDAVKYIKPTSCKNVDIVPADDTLMDLDLSSVKVGSAQVQALRLLVETMKDSYDVVLIDWLLGRDVPGPGDVPKSGSKEEKPENRCSWAPFPTSDAWGMGPVEDPFDAGDYIVLAKWSEHGKMKPHIFAWDGDKWLYSDMDAAAAVAIVCYWMPMPED